VEGGPPGSDPALTGMTAGPAEHRLAAILAAPDHPFLERTLVAILRDDDAAIRLAAVRTLAAIPPGPMGTRAIMWAASTDPEPAVRQEAVRALGRILEARLGSSKT